MSEHLKTAIVCGQCGGGVRMEMRVEEKYFVYECPKGHSFERPRARTRYGGSKYRTATLAPRKVQP